MDTARTSGVDLRLPPGMRRRAHSTGCEGLMSTIKIVKPQTEAEKATETTLDCWQIDCDLLRGLKLPPFQRGLRVNTKVTDLATRMANEIASTGSTVIDGVFCVGLFNGDRWLVDGQHRRQAFFMAEEILKERDRRLSAAGYVDVRVVHFKTMREMSQEFVKLNSRLVNMKPDDILRGLEEEYPAVLGKISKHCSFVGYDNIRRGDRSPMVSMAQIIRCWNASANEVPRPGGMSASEALDAVTSESADQLVGFLRCAFAAWGRDQGCYRLWGGLNIAICMWLYRRIVVSAYSVKTTKIDDAQFTKCLMSLGADSGYTEWLLGRNLNQRDMSPAYGKIKSIFVARIESDTGARHKLPQPEWGGRS